MEVLEPTGKIMEDEEEITGHENGVDSELDQERAQCVYLFLLRRGTPGHPPHFAIGLALGRASLGSESDFHLRLKGFFLPSNSLLAGKLWLMPQINIRKTSEGLTTSTT